MYHLPQWKKWKVALNFSEQKRARQLTHDMTSSFDLTTLSHLLLIMTWWIFPERTSLCLVMSSVTDTSAVRGIPTPTLLASWVSQSYCFQRPALNSQMCITPSCVHMPKFSMLQGGDRKVFWLSGTSVPITIALQSFPSKTGRVYKVLLNLLGVITFDVHLTEASWLRLLFGNHGDFLWGNLGQGA